MTLTLAPPPPPLTVTFGPQLPTDADHYAAVRRGALLLDRLYVRWAERIDLETLDLAGCDCCIIGQLYPSFVKGATALLGRSTPFDLYPCLLTEYGFDDQTAWDVTDSSFQTLTDLWIIEVTARQLGLW